MDIKEAIAHAQQVAEGCGSGNRDCAYQHDQLAGWLEELMKYQATGLTPERVMGLAEAEKTGRLRVTDVTGKCGSCAYYLRIDATAYGSCSKRPYGRDVVHDPKHPYMQVAQSKLKCSMFAPRVQKKARHETDPF